MYDPDAPTHSADECMALLNRMLLDPAELLMEIQPQGWNESTLVRVFHPTQVQRAAEHAAFIRNIRAISPAKSPEAADGNEDEYADRGGAEQPTPDTHEPGMEPERQVVELLGLALWDVFSDNHTVSDDAGIAFNLGSFRGSGDFIAEAINQRYPMLTHRYHYLDFYVGTALVSQRADLTPVYRWIFNRLRAAGCDWEYSFPRPYVVSFDGLCEPDDAFLRDPCDAVQAELEAAERERERAELTEQLREAHDADALRARTVPPPTIVAAYASVYGVIPKGWPQRTSSEPGGG